MVGLGVWKALGMLWRLVRRLVRWKLFVMKALPEEIEVQDSEASSFGAVYQAPRNGSILEGYGRMPVDGSAARDVEGTASRRGFPQQVKRCGIGAFS